MERLEEESPSGGVPGVIAFTLDPNLPDQNRVTKSIAHWHKRTNVRLVPRTNQPNFVTFRPGSGCSSHRRYGGGRLLSGWFAPQCASTTGWVGRTR